MSDNNTYKLVCEGIDLVIPVKVLSLKEEQELYAQIREKISKTETAFVFHEYKEYLAKKLIIGYENLLAEYSDGEESDTYQLLIANMYMAITVAYPPLSLDFVCTDLNTEKFMQATDLMEPSQFLKNLAANLKTKLAKETKKKIVKHKIVGPQVLKTKDNFSKLESQIKNNIIGQDHAVDVVVKHLKLMSTGLTQFSTLFFVGPTGVGKTELSKIIGERYSGNFFKINCAEYAGAHEYAKLIGSPPGYVGHTDRSLLKEKAEISNKWVFLFDEIEKADGKFQDFLLSLLDDGTCTDNMGNVLDFSKSLFIFTSNQGVSEIKYASIGFGKSEPSKKAIQSTILESVKKKFSPEFMNRIDDVVFFNSLSRDDVRSIVKLKLKSYPVEITEQLVDYVIDNSYSYEYGARNVARYIKNNLATLVADSILEDNTKKKKQYKLVFPSGRPEVLKSHEEKKSTQESNTGEILEVHVGGEIKTSPQHETGGEATGSTVRLKDAERPISINK